MVSDKHLPLMRVFLFDISRFACFCSLKSLESSIRECNVPLYLWTFHVCGSLLKEYSLDSIPQLAAMLVFFIRPSLR